MLGAPPSVLVDLGGYRLAVRRHGQGSPAVVFISGRGDSGRDWGEVIDRLETPTTSITYDRAGCGESDDLPNYLGRPKPASWGAMQLSDLLASASVDAPYVLAGHSLGGQIADAFAIRRPNEVVGLVLVDSVDPELNLDTDPPYPVIDDAEDARAGGGWQWDVDVSAQQFRQTQPRIYPPTVVVASAIWRWFGAKEPTRYRPFSLADVDQRWQRSQLQYAERWRGRLLVAHEAGHRVHQEAPELVAVAIDAVLAAANGRTPLQVDRAAVLRAGGSVRFPPKNGPAA